MFDRGSILRPSKNNPDWKIQGIPHFDMDPWMWTNPKNDEKWRDLNKYDNFFPHWLS